MVVLKFQGYISQLDSNLKSWMPLLPEICFIELAQSLKIILYDERHNHFLNIQLQSTFQHCKQSQYTVYLRTTSDANAQTYSFAFNEDAVASAFEDSLEFLRDGMPHSQNIDHAADNKQYQPNIDVNNQFNQNINPFNGFQHSNFSMLNPVQSAPLQSRNNRGNYGYMNNMQNPFQTVNDHADRRVSGGYSYSPPNHNTSQPNLPQSYMIYEETKPKKATPQKPTPMIQNFMDDQSYYQISSDNMYGSNVELHNFEEPKSLTEEEGFCNILTEAIAGGNVELAHEFVEKLAEKMMTINFSRLPRSSDFNILIQIADKNEIESTTITESVDPQATTVHTLKYLMYRKHGLPLDNQMWIIGKNLVKDEQTLSDCGIKSTGSTVYLYMKSLDSSNKKEVYANEEESQTDERVTLFFKELYDKAIQEELAEQLGYINVGNTEHVEREMNLMGAAPPRVVEGFAEGWICTSCTLKNRPTFEGCKVCSAPRPEDYQIPNGYKMTLEEVDRMENAKRNEELALQMEYQRKEKEAEAAAINYHQLLQAMDQKLLTNHEEFECSICFDTVEKDEGVMLRECLHLFCRECLAETIKNSEDPEIHCPYNDGFACQAVIIQQEIEELLSNEDYEKYLARCVTAAERGANDSFHCRSSNCIGWCFYEDDVNHFICPICNKKNCLTCKAIHPEQTCKEYQDDLKIRAENDEAAKKTQEMLQELINKGDAMNCPHCQVILQKKSGCDWMRCSMCRTEICWATKGPRWGPGGNGDTSGGCKCGINGRCAPNCGNCH